MSVVPPNSKSPTPPRLELASILDAVLDGQLLSSEEALHLLKTQQDKELRLLKEAADELRQRQVGEPVSYTTGCSLYLTNQCEMAPAIHAYPHKPGQNGAFVHTIDEIDALLELAHARKLRQMHVSVGGFWPELCIPGMECANLLKTYARLLAYLRDKLPEIHIIGFSPDEIEFLAVVSNRSARYLLELAKDHGLQELGGQGAEILVNAVRQAISPKKATVRRWLEIVATAQQLELPVVGRLEGGQGETLAQRIQHLERLRTFTLKHPGAFSRIEPVFWQWTATEASHSKDDALHSGGHNTLLRDRQKLLAVIRLYLGDAIPCQQTFRLLDGAEEAQEGLQWGANAFGSTDATAYEAFLAGVRPREEYSEADLQRLIREAGRPALLI
jgi:FO synthase subunit 2